LLEVDSIFYGVIFYATHGKDVNNDAGRDYFAYKTTD